MSRILSHSRLTLRQAGANIRPGLQKRNYNFASSEYKSCFGGLPVADGVQLRKDTIAYLDKFDQDNWYNDPVTTILNGKKLEGGNTSMTVDAFEAENGTIRLASSVEVEQVVSHMHNFKPQRDYRESVRKVEAEIFDNFSPALIGNQALDFRKQDGVTEIEESVQANLVERRLNNLLLEDENAGKVSICRAPAFVGCVSNFSNFLDLSRKCLRNIELGVPAIILSRRNTTQHMYRWTKILVDLMEKHGVDPGLVTYAAFSLEDQQRIFKESPEGALYITCNREIASLVKSMHGNVMSSTGGPNTLVAPQMTQEISDAIQLSCMIENSGQCTALRHAYVGGATDEDMVSMFDAAPTISSPQDALKNGAFAGVFDGTHPAPFDLAEGYSTHPSHSNIAYRVSSQLPGDDIEEHWRQTYVDMTAANNGDFLQSDDVLDALAGWLVRNQPISLAMNTVNDDMTYARKLFERTGQVVYTVGHEGNVALTCQARPQEGEVFGEFPVRKDLGKYTRYPVVVPSPTPAYNCHYQQSFLEDYYRSHKDGNDNVYLKDILKHIRSESVGGFCLLLKDYLADAVGANRGNGKDTGGPDRTILYGLQRPPLNGQYTLLRCGKGTTFDELAPTLTPFYCTNAVTSVKISCDPDNVELISTLATIGEDVPVSKHTDEEFERLCIDMDFYNVVQPEALSDNINTNSLEEFPMVGQFVSLSFLLVICALDAMTKNLLNTLQLAKSG